MIEKRSRKLWGLDTIAGYLGISTDKARRLAKDPRVPISKPEGSGMFFAFAEELDAWQRGETATEGAEGKG